MKKFLNTRMENKEKKTQIPNKIPLSIVRREYPKLPLINGTAPKHAHNFYSSEPHHLPSGAKR